MPLFMRILRSFPARQRQNGGFVPQRQPGNLGEARDAFQILVGQSLNCRFLRLSNPRDFDLHHLSLFDGATGVSLRKPLRLFPTRAQHRRQTVSHPPLDTARSQPWPQSESPAMFPPEHVPASDETEPLPRTRIRKRLPRPPARSTEDSASTPPPRETRLRSAPLRGSLRLRIEKDRLLRLAACLLRHVFSQSSWWTANTAVPPIPKQRNRRAHRALAPGAIPSRLVRHHRKTSLQ